MGWSLWLPARRLLGLLRSLIWPAALLALLAVLHELDLFEPWERLRQQDRGAICLTGNVGDLHWIESRRSYRRDS